MLIVQILLLAFGVVGGWLLAVRLRRLPWDRASRSRAVIGFGAGALVWAVFAVTALSAPMSWVFIGTVMALYLPCLIVIVASRANSADVARDA